LSIENLNPLLLAQFSNLLIVGIYVLYCSYLLKHSLQQSRHKEKFIMFVENLLMYSVYFNVKKCSHKSQQLFLQV